MARTILIADDVMEVLKRCKVTETSVTLPDGKLDRGLYARVNQVLEAAGCKWDKRAKCHVSKTDPRPLLNLAAKEGGIVNVKNVFQAFYTPATLAAQLVALAGVEDRDTVLEPSAGEGALADVCKAVGAVVTCIELNPTAANVLRDKGYPVEECDFLDWEPTDKFDMVVMNPPFNTEGHPQADIEHVLHAWDCLKPGGVLAAIMSPGWKSRNNSLSVQFQNFCEETDADLIVVPAGTFKQSGTDIQTVIIIAEK